MKPKRGRLPKELVQIAEWVHPIEGRKMIYHRNGHLWTQVWDAEIGDYKYRMHPSVLTLEEAHQYATKWGYLRCSPAEEDPNKADPYYP